jgi:hypothetical protein
LAGPLGRISVFSSLGSNLLLRPVELGSIDPHAMQNDRDLRATATLALSTIAISSSLIAGVKVKDANALGKFPGDAPSTRDPTAHYRQMDRPNKL